MLTYYITLGLVMLFAALAERHRLAMNIGTGLEAEHERKLFRNCVVVCAVILIFVAGLRYHVGTDYTPYTHSFDLRSNRLWHDLLTWNEPGLGLLAWIGHFITTDYVILFILASLVTVSLNIWTIYKYSDDIFLGIVLYILLGSWHNSFNAIRQYLAAAVLFAGHHYMFERKLWKYALVVLGATCFHRTAIVMLPIYFIADREMTFKTTLQIVLIGILLNFATEFLFAIMSYFKGTEQSVYAYMQQNVNPLRILSTLPPVLLAFLAPKEFRNQPENAFYLALMALNASFMFGTGSSAYLARIGIYTETFLALGIPRFLQGFETTFRRQCAVCVVLFFMIFWSYELYVRNSLNHFQWIFSR